MPLHDITRTGESGIEDVYATGSADDHLPKFRMPKHESSARTVYNLGMTSCCLTATPAKTSPRSAMTGRAGSRQADG